MQRSFRFLQMDVFADCLGSGNPLAVVLDAQTLDTAQMQRIARWTNLSETAFVLPPSQAGADYRLRIFTSRQELPFAGHPSVGGAYAAIEAGLVDAGKTALIQECAAGLLPVRVDGIGAARRIHVQAPPARIEAAQEDTLASLSRALGVPLEATRVAHIDNGPQWIVCDLDRAECVRALQPDMAAIAALCPALAAVGVSVFGRQRDDRAAIAVRAFCPADGMPEDPVTGSANAAIAAWLHQRGELASSLGTSYCASQGREIGRDGYVQLSVDAEGRVSLGGDCVIGVRGRLEL
jgi:PhzF family phenazine biosynthesis protein